MQYIHSIYNPSEIDDGLAGVLKRFHSSDVVFRYEQCLDWFLCQESDNFHLLVTFSDAEVVASSVIRRVTYPFLKKYKVIVQSGPVYRDLTALQVHLEYLLSNYAEKTIHIQISPCFEAADENSLSDVVRRVGFCPNKSQKGLYTSTIVIDTTCSIEKIEKGFSSALNRQLRKAKRSAIDVRVAESAEDVSAFVEGAINFYTDRGIGITTGSILNSYIKNKALAAGQGLVMVAEYEKEIVAGIFIDIVGRRAVYNIGFKEDANIFRKLPLSHKLHYHAIEWAVNKNCRFYDFGGFNLVNKKDGINQFKLSFSRNIQVVSKNYIYAADNIWHNLFKLNDYYKAKKALLAKQ
jgi:hypothetical protein